MMVQKGEHRRQEGEYGRREENIEQQGIIENAKTWRYGGTKEKNEAKGRKETKDEGKTRDIKMQEDNKGQ